MYILENLGCAHCASKMEEKIQALPQVEFAAITFATKQLQVVTNTDAELLEEFQKICASIESEVVVTKKRRRIKPEKGSLQKADFQKIKRICGRSESELFCLFWVCLHRR